ncbi:MAG: hypothetical protein ACUVWZ_14170, partial [Anaerolineae bacterium]
YPDPLPTSYAFDLRIWSDPYEGNILTVYSLAVCSRNPQVAYAGTEADQEHRWRQNLESHHTNNSEGTRDRRASNLL